ncbi:hypothetical protein CH339_09810 [Rhodobium orientis]|uniref:HTH marR-type domain-containing protein n=2 Tax=Rhodobium orientis TaxID=34017 RepID=A0A327JQ74_9HYPH|nr:hypothetical protein [Rhodobium orientis]RAI27523.1 hypothetical protein CH339_09810 [Rhodobium orientis]
MPPEAKKPSHRLTALNIIRDKGVISRTELARLMKLSKPKITLISQELIDAGLIEVTGQGESTSNGGRKPTLLSLRKAYPKVVIGVDIGTYNLRIACGYLSGEHQLYRTEKTNRSQFPNSILRQASNAILELMRDHGLARDDVVCVGVSIGGLVDSDSGRVVYSPNFKWENVELAKLLSEQVELPVYVENCTKTMALGDLFYDKLTNSDVALFVNHGFGVGSAVVRNRQLVPGYCELGHITMHSGKEVICYCGKNNCLETQASGWAIEWMAMDRLDKELSAQEVAELAATGNEVARDIYQHVGHYLGEAIAASANLLSPDYIIVAGGISQASDWYQDALEEAFQANTMRFIYDKARIVFSDCKNESAIRGIIKLALTKGIFMSEATVSR